MRETVVEKHLRKKATAAGALVRKMVWPGHRGAPDRLVVWPDDPTWAAGDGLPTRIDFVELKRPGGTLEDHQVREHEKLRSMGCAVYTLDSIEAVDRYVAKRTS
jgi:hypothetical protein